MPLDNMDFFSLLPESLILVILSFLPFKEAVARTCVLNKKWLNIWQPGNNIDFNENFFVDSTSDEIKQAQRNVFINFITNWIAHFTNRGINKFSLIVSNPQTCRDTVERCVAFAMQRGVRDLNLDFSDPNWNENDLGDHEALFQLPSIVYQLGSSLESLKLYSCGFGVQDFFNFSALKDVSLGWIEVRTKTLETLLLTCPTIESLSLEKCWNSVNISLNDDQPVGLTRLVINNCDSEYFIFNAPNLKYFKYSGAVFTSDIYVRPNVIEEVYIDFGQESEFDERGNELCKILIDFAAAKTLTVCSYLLQVVPSGDEPVRIQIDLNVRHLILKTQIHPHEFCGFEFLLNSCPMLEKITLDIGQRAIFSEEDYETPFSGIDLKKYWHRRRVTPQCLRSSLKAIEVIGSRTTHEELVTIAYLMFAGKVLEQININLFKENEEGLNELRHGRTSRVLAKAKKASENLQININ
ncbi:putative F-box/LRR-repeat protein [Trifolium repens]|nr:putative F-box/LRR-repeat protein [Trifolium repens]